MFVSAAGERFEGDEQPPLGEPIGVGAQRLRCAVQRFLGVQRRVAGEFAGADLATPERVGHRFDLGESG